jgi:chemotaxis signal transduction protein/HPt (histidine-containing phosphotransfer) domain-containing protein
MQAYIDGSRENLDTMDRQLLALEQNPGNLEAVEEIFRAAHTLKGMSGTMGFEKIAHLTHEMENVLDKLRSKIIPVTPQVIDLIFETFDVLRILVNDSISQTDSNVDLHTITGKLSTIASGAVPAAAAAPAAPARATAAPSPAFDSAPGGGESGASITQFLAEFHVSEFEISGLLDEIHSGRSLYILSVSLAADCLLKGPRIFMVLRGLDNLQCEINKSIPEVKDLEQEKFDQSFKMLVTTDRSAAEIKDTIESISEINTVDVVAFTPGDLKPAGTGGAPAAAAPPPAAPAARSAPGSSAPPQATPASAPVSAPAASVSSAPVAVKEAETPAPADSSDKETDEEKKSVELVQLVSFAMAGETYALEIAQVEGIINMYPITRVPKSPPYIEGVINMRGDIVPVINLRKRLRLQVKEKIADDQIMILTFEEEKVKVGFLVDHVKEVLRLPKTSIDPPSKVSDGVNVEYLRGVGKMGNKIIILLKAEKIVFG